MDFTSEELVHLEALVKDAAIITQSISTTGVAGNNMNKLISPTISSQTKVIQRYLTPLVI